MRTKGVKISTKILSIVFSAGLMLADGSAWAFFMPEPNPYTFGPQGRPIESIVEWGTPVQMFEILPGRPVAAHDQYGNSVYFTPEGKMTVRIGKDGSFEFSLKGVSRSLTPEGNIVQSTEMERGSNRMVLKNGNGQVIGYQELGYGGKILREYDFENNVTKTYQYDKYGKNTLYIIDELTQSKTVFDSSGKPVYDVDFMDNQTAWYSYDKNGVLREKEDAQGNKTFFDGKGNMQRSEDKYGKTLLQYQYKYDSEGRYILDKSVDEYGTATYFTNGRPVYEMSASGQVVRQYFYEGQALRFSYDTASKESTWYGVDGKPMCVTYKDMLVSEWVYDKGRLVGLWDELNGFVITYDKGMASGIYLLSEKPDAQKIKSLVDETAKGSSN
ncbi:MAG: hypothetical protein JW803_00055 [Endomicrobiales bacterium]|nr:hypothetical protein [Endomicrobiales bacterium]